MDYTLIGNGSADLTGLDKHTDVYIQVNDCRHSSEISEMRNGYVFITNSGDPALDMLRDVVDIQKRVPFGRFVLARNPLFYMLKGCLLRILGRSAQSYKVCSDYKKLKLRYPIQKVSFLFTLKLEFCMLFSGMPLRSMPSTGLIAYAWIKSQMNCGDSLKLAGFSFEGWDKHPWAIEKQTVKAISIPFNWESEDFWSKG